MGGRSGRVAALAGIGLAVTAVTAGMALGGGLDSGLSFGGKTSRSTTFRNQVKFLDTRLASQYAKPIAMQTGFDLSASNLGYTGRYRGRYVGLARAAARRYGVPEALFLRLVQQESGWNHGAVSSKGARGLAQLMPGTARKLGVNAHDALQNLDGGARYLRMMYDKFGSWRLALAAYNAGPDAVQKYGGVPPYRETRSYVRAILGG